MTRCPLRPFKEEPAHYSELFKLYSFREKHILPEVGGYYDQPNYYIEAMIEMDGAMGDVNDVQDKMKKHHDKKTEQLKAIGINFTPKK